MTDTDEQQGTPPKPSLIPRVVTFFALYPEALGLDDRTSFVLPTTYPISGFERTALHLAEGESPLWLDSARSTSLVVSIRFHRGIRKQHVVDEHDEKLMEVIQSVAGEAFPPFIRTAPSAESDTPNRDESKGMAYTVVEMTTQLAMPGKLGWEACDLNNDLMGPTLTRCIEALLLVVDSYRLTEKISIPIPARERLGPGIVAVTRAADPERGGWDAPPRYVINVFAAYGGQPFIRGKHRPDTLDEMTQWLMLVAIGHPSVAIAQIQADLNHAMHCEGNFRSVLLFAHSASEVLLDTALMAMLFEEGTTSEQAVSRFIRPLKTRVLTEYHDRIGGAWGPKGENPVSNWIRNLLLIRHRVAHAGYSPNYEEARIAREAYFSLGTHLRDGLASSADKYPFTAGLLVTTAGFERRGMRSDASEAAERALDERLDDFVVWRNDLIQLRA